MKTTARLSWRVAHTVMVAFVAGAAFGAEPEAKGSVQVDGFALRYRVEGGGTPTLVVGSSVYYPRVFSKALRDHLRLAFMDHRGFVPAPPGTEVSDFALEKLLGDMERVRQALGLGRVVVVGHSGHSYMALEYAKRYPDHVSHVVMIGISPDLGPANEEAAREYWDETASSERKRALRESMGQMPDAQLTALPPREQFVQGYLRETPKIWFDPRYDAAPLWEGVEPNGEMFAHVWGTVFRDIDITTGLAELDIPVFLALGRYDFLVAPESSWDDVRPRFQDLTVRVFERSGHTPPLEEPDLFDEALLEWLADHP